MHSSIPNCFQRLLLVLAAPATLLMSQGQAKAVLNVRIFDDGPNLKVTVDGSISGSPGTSKGDGFCGALGFLSGESNSFPSLLCTGNDRSSPVYPITGPVGYGGNGFIFADLVQGFSFMLVPTSYTEGNPFYKSTYQLDNTYVLGQPFFSSATFNNKSLASEGFTTTGLIGTWSIVGTNESINVCIGSDPCPPSSSVPGPLPLLGAGAAFSWSRRLRRRTASPLTPPPQA